jgi:hypothetical protein
MYGMDAPKGVSMHTWCRYTWNSGIRGDFSQDVTGPKRGCGRPDCFFEGREGPKVYDSRIEEEKCCHRIFHIIKRPKSIFVLFWTNSQLSEGMCDKIW